MNNPIAKRVSAERAPLGQRRTQQREVIADVIQTAEGPLTVAEIHRRGQERIAGLGIATVYRTIKLLLEEQLIDTVILPTGETRYESSGLGHHHHFHCRVCDDVFDVASCPIPEPPKELDPGFVVEDHEVTLYGVCPACV